MLPVRPHLRRAAWRAALLAALTGCGQEVPQEPVAEQSVRGRLLAPGGRPAAGVPVFLYRPGRPGEVTARGRTDREGRFRVPVPVPGVGYYLVLAAPGAAPLVRRLAGGAWEMGTLRAGAGATLAGTVVDDRDAAVPGAEVRLTGPEGGGAAAALAATVTWPPMRTDRRGRFRCLHLVPGRYRIRAAKADTRPAAAAVEVPAGGAEVRLRLLRLWTLRGRILDEGDRPVADATVTVTRGTERRTVRTDGEGRFSVAGLPWGGCRLTAAAPGHERAAVALAAPRRDPLTVRLPRAPVLTVTARRAGTGAPLAAFTVTLWPAAAAKELPPPKRTGRAGRLRWDPAPAGRWFVVVTAPGRALAVDGPVACTPGCTATAAVTLGREAVLEGLVAFAAPDRRPASGAAVALRMEILTGRAGPCPAAWRREAAADPEGLFRFGGLAPGRYRLTVTAPGAVPVHLPVSVRAGGEILVVPLERTGELAGRLHAAPYRPAAGERLALVGPSPREVTADRTGRFLAADLLPGLYRLEWRDEVTSLTVFPGRARRVDFLREGGCRIAVQVGPPTARIHLILAPLGELADLPPWHGWTDGTGRFVFTHLPPGDYRLRAYTPLGLPFATRPVELIPGTRRRLELTLPRGEVRGVVAAALTGRPLGGAEVRLKPAAEADPWGGEPVRTAADGVFRVRHVPPGRYRLTVRAPGFPPVGERVTVRPDAPAASLRFRLHGGAILTGEVRRGDPGGARVNAFLTVRTAAGEAVRGWEGYRVCPGGRFRLEGLPPGEYRLRVSKPGFRPVVRTVRVTSGYHPPVVFLLTASE